MTALETRNAKIAALTVTHNAEQRRLIALQEPLVKELNEAGNVIVGLIGQIRDDSNRRELALTPEQKQQLADARAVQTRDGTRLTGHCRPTPSLGPGHGRQGRGHHCGMGKRRVRRMMPPSVLVKTRATILRTQLRDAEEKRDVLRREDEYLAEQLPILARQIELLDSIAKELEELE